MVYLAISYEGPLLCHVFKSGSIKSNDYEKYVLPKLSRAMVNLMDEDRVINNIPYNYIDDNCSVHWGGTSLETAGLYGVNTLEWPARSPDLNPVENVISMMKKAVFSRRREYHDLETLSVIFVNVVYYFCGV